MSSPTIHSYCRLFSNWSGSFQTDTHCATLAKTMLVLRQPQTLFPSFLSPHHGRTSSTCGLESAWLDEEEGWYSEAVQWVQLNHRKLTTISPYSSKWKHILVWFQSQGIWPMLVCIQNILDYQLHLKSANLSLSLLGVHLAAISAFHPPIQGESISFNSLAIQVLKRYCLSLSTCERSSPFVGP